VTDPLPLDDATAAHPLVVEAVRLADDLLAPHAAEVDAGTVPRSHLDALGSAGLFGLSAPPALGGSQAPAPVVRAVNEALAGADLATWFVWAQHHSPVRALVSAGGFDDLVRDLAAGRRVAGIAFSHLRRPDPGVRATRDGDGWRLDGTAPWYTGWGINDVALVAGVGPGQEAVFGLVPAREGPGLSASAPMRVAALESAVTVTLTLSGCRIPGDAVVSVEPLERWRAGDRVRTLDVQPAVFGVAGSALRLLHRLGVERDQPAAVAAAQRLGEAVRTLREQVYRLVDDAPAGSRAQLRLSLRAGAQQLMTDATTALVIAGAGGSMAAGAPAQRKAREALFMLVQAQTASGREAALGLWGQHGGEGTGEAGVSGGERSRTGRTGPTVREGD
jgi:alkylation response protein AidB-like acyl-CoA dehydrogenase